MRSKARATEALRAAREAQGETLEPGEIRGMDAEEILNYFYGQVVFDAHARRAGRGRSTPTRSAASSCWSRWSTPTPARWWPRPTPS